MQWADWIQNLRKCLQHLGDPQQEQSERKKIRRHDNMQRGHRWSITYFSGIPVHDALNATKRKKPHISPVLLKWHFGCWGSWQMGWRADTLVHQWDTYINKAVICSVLWTMENLTEQGKLPHLGQLGSDMCPEFACVDLYLLLISSGTEFILAPSEAIRTSLPPLGLDQIFLK